MRQYSRNWRDRAGFIARVLRFGPQHVCGICRTRFVNRLEAESCLDNCWEELLGLDPVIRQAVQGELVFKCRYCARRHGRYANAHDCAQACRQHFLHKHDLERQILSELAEMPLPPKRKLQRKAGEQQISAVTTTSSVKDPTGGEEGLEAIAPGAIDDPIMQPDFDVPTGDDHLDPSSLVSESNEKSENEKPVAKSLEDWSDYDPEDDRELEEIVDAV